MQCVFDFCRELPAMPVRSERLFFALLPDAETSRRVVRLRERFICEYRIPGTQLNPECLHVSLHHVGDYRRLRTRFIYAARKAGDAVAMPPFEMAFRFVGTFEAPLSRNGNPGNRPLVLLAESDALSTLHERLGAAMKKNGLRASAHFMPHMTLLYGPASVGMRAIAPICYTVDRFALIHSELGRTRHNIVEQWPLRPCARLGPGSHHSECAWAVS